MTDQTTHQDQIYKGKFKEKIMDRIFENFHLKL